MNSKNERSSLYKSGPVVVNGSAPHLWRLQADLANSPAEVEVTRTRYTIKTWKDRSVRAKLRAGLCNRSETKETMARGGRSLPRVKQYMPDDDGITDSIRNHYGRVSYPIKAGKRYFNTHFPYLSSEGDLL